MTDQARFLKKKKKKKTNCGLNLGPAGLNQAQNEVFCYFLEFGSQVFLEIEYDDTLQQCLTLVEVKPTQKSFGDQIWAKLVFFPFS